MGLNNCLCKKGCASCSKINICEGVKGPRGPQGIQGPKGNTGATGPTGQSQMVAYGGLYNRTVRQFTVPPLNVQVQLPMPNHMPYQNVVLETNSITIIESGDYLVTQKFSALTTGGDAFEVKISLRINGVLIPEMEHSLVLNIIAISDSSDLIIRLNAGDILDFVIFSENGGTVNFKPTTTPALTVVKLGD